MNAVRTIPLVATIFSAAAALTAAFAQPAPQTSQRPAALPPASTAPFTERESWCERYATWLITQTPTQAPIPADVRPTQRFENEFNSCKPDPREYELQTRAELSAVSRPTAPAPGRG